MKKEQRACFLLSQRRFSSSFAEPIAKVKGSIPGSIWIILRSLATVVFSVIANDAYPLNPGFMGGRRRILIGLRCIRVFPRDEQDQVAADQRLLIPPVRE